MTQPPTDASACFIDRYNSKDTYFFKSGNPNLVVQRKYSPPWSWEGSSNYDNTSSKLPGLGKKEGVDLGTLVDVFVWKTLPRFVFRSASGYEVRAAKEDTWADNSGSIGEEVSLTCFSKVHGITAVTEVGNQILIVTGSQYSFAEGPDKAAGDKQDLGSAASAALPVLGNPSKEGPHVYLLHGSAWTPYAVVAGGEDGDGNVTGSALKKTA
ncbi:hypothetical protein LKL35_36925 [Streptomyces sp. ET3-23]|uniref:hypothetical protein n=1 Tax=Streptomyces sp. ET3-23 TaxID=2885643 RepID=UPI001D11BD9F|nr:hypothetical protein [Streptomyces sp. ET3-23]MCC2280908.1 hypothetical protein [Streptomyces sp. ET3-23]